MVFFILLVDSTHFIALHRLFENYDWKVLLVCLEMLFAH